MLVTEEDKSICAKYSKRDRYGFVHCSDCPLNISDGFELELACKATHHYDKSRKEWILDD